MHRCTCIKTTRMIPTPAPWCPRTQENLSSLILALASHGVSFECGLQANNNEVYIVDVYDPHKTLYYDVKTGHLRDSNV